MSSDTFEIQGVRIGRNERPYVLAEIGINHEGDVGLAEKMIKAAKEAGADGVKFQTFHAEDLVNKKKSPEYFELFSRVELDRPAHVHLFNVAREAGIAFISTPFGEREADMLAEIGVPAIKIASGDLTNHPLLEHAGKLGLPVILSTGMSFVDEVRSARDVLIKAGCPNLVMLHCVSRYPTQPHELNLLSIKRMLDEFPEPIGFSDHTEGTWAAGAAVAIGARFIEKHFTIDKNLPGPDHKLSVDPDELSALVIAVRNVFDGLGEIDKKPCSEELKNRALGRKGLYASCDLEAGKIIGRDEIKISRPEGAIPARDLDRVLGCEIVKSIRAGEELTWDHLHMASGNESILKSDKECSHA